jgi:hypothetical protein
VWTNGSTTAEVRAWLTAAGQVVAEQAVGLAVAVSDSLSGWLMPARNLRRVIAAGWFCGTWPPVAALTR